MTYRRSSSDWRSDNLTVWTYSTHTAHPVNGRDVEQYQYIFALTLVLVSHGIMAWNAFPLAVLPAVPYLYTLVDGGVDRSLV
jgi:hypothetical protein